jgi:hypothetical protein
MVRALEGQRQSMCITPCKRKGDEAFPDSQAHPGALIEEDIAADADQQFQVSPENGPFQS